MKKRFSIILGIMTMAILVTLAICHDATRFKLYESIESGDFHIKIVSSVSTAGSPRETLIDSSGRATVFINHIHEKNQTLEIGYYSDKEIKAFLKYLVRRDALYNSNDRNATAVMSSEDLYFEIQIGDEMYILGVEPKKDEQGMASALEAFNEIEFTKAR